MLGCDCEDRLTFNATFIPLKIVMLHDFMMLLFVFDFLGFFLEVFSNQDTHLELHFKKHWIIHFD